MILVDTSIWIELFKSRPEGDVLERVIRQNPSEIGLCDIILTEVLQGVRNDEASENIKYNLSSYFFFSPCDLEIYIAAASLYRNCRSHGITIRSLSDSIIASIALKYRVPVWTLDKDFKKIQKVVPLRLYEGEI